MLVAASLFTVSARADEWTKRTILTVNEPIQIANTFLQPGKYELRLIANSTYGVDRHVVQIFNGTGQHVINTVVTQDTEREQATGSTVFTWWETPPGTARALRDWYFPGEVNGDEFPYPKHPKQIATVVPPPAAAAPAPAAAPEAAPAPAAPAPPPPVEQPAPQPAQPEATPPPAEQPAPAPPAELPKTASFYVSFGLCGLALAAFGGMILLKRTA